jgi:hypothetical protein
VQLKGSVATIENAFHVTMGLYHDPIENRDFYAPDREPTVDLPFQLWHISGLDNYSIPRPELTRRPLEIKAPATTGSCPQQSFCGSDMRAAYYQGTALTGKGQNIGLVEFAGYDIHDLKHLLQERKTEENRSYQRDFHGRNSIFPTRLNPRSAGPEECLFSHRYLPLALHHLVRNPFGGCG